MFLSHSIIAQENIMLMQVMAQENVILIIEQDIAILLIAQEHESQNRTVDKDARCRP